MLEYQKITIIVLLYGKKISESKTYASLLELDCSEVNIILWNNGPNYLHEQCKEKLNKLHCRELYIKETTDNISLSLIYNRAIEIFVSDLYVILDDDSSITSEYFSSINSIKHDSIGVPQISYKGNGYYPTSYGKYYNKLGNVDNIDRFQSITSGLVIGSKVVERFKEVYGDLFDTRLRFYGIDTTFFYRLININAKIKVIPGFEHKLSRLDNQEKNELLRFRKNERGYASGKIYRYYFKRGVAIKKITYSLFIYILRAIFRKKQTFSVSSMLFAFFKS